MTQPTHTVSQWLERLSAVHRNLMRRFSNKEGLQLVHVEILQYLSICNHYSDTTQAISEYLGQTKGSISQSVGHLDENNYIKRVQDKSDKRVFHLLLTAKGHAVIEKLLQSIHVEGSNETETALKSVLAYVQKENQLKGFDICLSCKFNQSPGKKIFICGLTHEKLSVDDVKKICREHESV